jgi:hypothetical protein
MSQSPLSRAIRELERDLGLVLFVRTTRRVELTVAAPVGLSTEIVPPSASTRSCGVQSTPPIHHRSWRKLVTYTRFVRAKLLRARVCPPLLRLW